MTNNHREQVPPCTNGSHTFARQGNDLVCEELLCTVRLDAQTLKAKKPRAGDHQSPGASKYKNRRTWVHGEAFHSAGEAAHYCKLLDLRSAQQECHRVQWIARQIAFPLHGTHYVADFLVVFGDGRLEVQDVKGALTEAYKRAEKQMRETWGIEIVRITEWDYEILKRHQQERRR